MKRYLLFVGENYYPIGGWGDYQGDFDTWDEAWDAAETAAATAYQKDRFVHVIDGQRGEYVCSFDRGTGRLVTGGRDRLTGEPAGAGK